MVITADRRCRAQSRRRRVQGYNLVILMVAVTVMTILVAAALPSWSTAVRRDKEEELIFRGLQYVEAIRVFQQRFGRLPSRIEELVEVEPRCIRQLWPDPFTGKRDWVLLRGEVPAGAAGETPPPEDPEGRPSDENLPDPTVAQGPIRGVRSRHRGDSLKTFFDKDRYEQWVFSLEMLTGGGAITGVAPGGVTQGARLNVRWLGRPFRPGVQPQGANPSDEEGGGG
jgi:type II secretory pathway pseudopilin PulG